MSLSSSMQLLMVASLTKQLDLAPASVPLRQTWKATLADGTGAGAADLVYHDTRTLALSATENLDLAGGLTDPLGAVLTFARVKALAIRAAKTNTNNVLVGGDVTTTWFPMFGAETDSLVIRPGEVRAMFCDEDDAVGWPVVAATADLLKVTNSAGVSAVSYDILIIGAST